ncbi:MAG: hypothetical protein K2W93_06560, partial [Burkholderiaceae bacterium]|nr:hypothetical protein [Burkholderiaceae bacterium]
MWLRRKACGLFAWMGDQICFKQLCCLGSIVLSCCARRAIWLRRKACSHFASSSDQKILKHLCRCSIALSSCARRAIWLRPPDLHQKSLEHVEALLDHEQGLTKFNRLAVLAQDLG